MDEFLRSIANQLPLAALIPIIGVAVYVLSKGADVLVGEAVTLSRRFNVSPVIVGATVVSLGTTAPETAVSVLSAIEGDPGLALGNAVGSIICNGALIIGVASLIRPIPVDPLMVRRQGFVQYGAALLLVAFSFPFFSGGRADVLSSGGLIPRWVGFLFVALLAGYLVISVRWSRRSSGALLPDTPGDGPGQTNADAPLFITILKLAGGLALVIVSSQVLIPAVEATALRIGVPRSVVAASLVALGTSLPELVTAITASRRGHGELAFGNVIGANVLNVLWVVGLSASVTPGGLAVSANFFSLFYPAMLILGALLYIAAIAGRGRIGRPVGVVLIALYAGLIVLGYAA